MVAWGYWEKGEGMGHCWVDWVVKRRERGGGGGGIG